MELIVSASRSIGAIPVLISQATLVAPDNSDAEMDRIRLEYQGLSHAAVIRAYEETYKVIRDLGAKTGTPVIDVTGLMNGKGEYFSDHVHTSPEGSAKLAEIVADQLGPILAERPPGDPDTD